MLDRRYDPQWQDLTGFFHAPMPPAARCSIPTARAPKDVALACNSGIKQPVATGQAIILSLSVADDVVASMLPEKAVKLLRWKSPWHSPPLLDEPSGRTPLCSGRHGQQISGCRGLAGQSCPAASINSSGREYDEPEEDAGRDAARSQPPAPAQFVKGRAGPGTGDRSGTLRW